MAGFFETTETLVVKDSYTSGGKTYYQQATVTVTVFPEGRVDWTIQMSNDRSGSSGRAVYLHIVIGGTVSIYGPNYTTYSDSGTSKWLTFPTGNGSSKSGSFTLSDNSVKEFSIAAYVCCMRKSATAGTTGSVTLTRDFWTDVTANTPTIENHKNGTFSIRAAAGKEGTNNEVNNTTLYYRKGSSGSFSSAGSLSLLNQSLSCADSVASQSIYAYIKADGEYNSAQSNTASSVIENYKAPKSPGKPALTESSFKNNRLTIKQNWTYSWTAAAQTNSSSPVKGYWIRIWRLPNGSAEWINVKETEWESQMTTYTFNPVTYNFTAGDKVQFEVAAYSKNGVGTKLWSAATGTRNGENVWVLSEQRDVDNTGIMQVKTADGWKEGQVYVKANGTWHEAESVNVKVNGSWKESE